MGSGSFASNATYSVGASSAYWVIAADVNGDGQMDLISANDGNPGGSLHGIDE